MTVEQRRSRFRELHAEGLFVMPNPWDVGSACRLAAAGFPLVVHNRSQGAVDEPRLQRPGLQRPVDALDRPRHDERRRLCCVGRHCCSG